MINGAAADQVC